MQPEVTREHRSSDGWRPVVISGLLSAVLVYLPLGQLWLYVPLLLLGWRVGGRAALAGLGIAWAIAIPLSLLGGGGIAALVPSLVQLAVFTGVGLGFGVPLLKGRTLTRAAVWATAPWVVLATAGIAAGLTLDRASLDEMLQQAVVAPAEAMFTQLEKSGSSDAELVTQVAQYRTFLKEKVHWLLYLAPSFIALSLMLALWTNIVLVRTLEPGFAGLEPLRSWRPPESWFGGLIIALVLTLSGIQPLVAIGLNLLMIGGGVYLLAGTAVLAWYGVKLRLGPLLWVGVIALMMLSGGLPMMAMLAMLGVLDFWLDLRRRWPLAGDRGEPLDDV